MRRTALLVVLGLTLAAPVPGAVGRRAPKTHTVTIDATRFEPAALTVAPGDTVIWRNVDLFPHTATSRLGVFDSKEIKPGHSWKYVVPRKGLFEYVCSLHPGMKASLRVR